MTQVQQIKKYLKEGNDITPLQALHKFGCFRLASVICKLKAQGLDIITNIVHNYDTDKNFAQYHIRMVKP